MNVLLSFDEELNRENFNAIFKTLDNAYRSMFTYKK